MALSALLSYQTPTMKQGTNERASERTQTGAGSAFLLLNPFISHVWSLGIQLFEFVWFHFRGGIWVWGIPPLRPPGLRLSGG